MLVYSYSKINTFKQCPRKFAFTYIEKPAVPKIKPIETFMGDIIHRALRKLYEDRLFNKILSEEELLSYFEEEWQRSYSPEVQIIRSQFSVEDYLKTGKVSLKKYYQRHYPFDQSQTLGLEYKITVELEKDIFLTGIIDRLAKDSKGVYEIHDYKTNRELLPHKNNQENRQLSLYQLAIEVNYPDVKEIKLIWHYLLFDTSITVRNLPADKETLKKEILQEIFLIEKSREFPTRPSNLCDWCEFQRICPAWQHKFQKSENPHLAEEPSLLVQKLALLEEEFAQIEKEYKEERALLKEALIEYALKHGLERIFGDEYVAKIKKSLSIIFPKKGEKEREDLEQRIKELGLWEELSDLNLKALEKKLKNQEFSRETIEVLKEFIKEKANIELFLSRIEKE